MSFAAPVRRWPNWPCSWNDTVTSYKTAIFRQVNKDKPNTHHDALELPNGEIVLLTTCYKASRQPFSSCQPRLRPMRSRRSGRAEFSAR
jgi:hypothetical protein